MITWEKQPWFFLDVEVESMDKMYKLWMFVHCKILQKYIYSSV